MHVAFNKPYIPLLTLRNLALATLSGTISGNGAYTKRCHREFEQRFGFRKVFLTTSCTDALEMTAILAGIGPGDEVILPSFTFVSTANAFLLRGAKLVFADVLPTIPNIDPAQVESLISPRTKAIVVVHYCGIACEMDRIMELARANNLVVIEDAAHSIDSCYKGKPLGSIGHFATFSFHETKNISCGEGGLLVINDENYINRAEIIWEKGTNRAAFYRGEVGKYNWIDIGSSFLPSDTLASILFMQLQRLEKIQRKRISHWNMYHRLLKPLEDQGNLKLAEIPSFATINGNMFYFLMSSVEERDRMINHLRVHNIQAVFHYLPLHSSPYFTDKHDGRPLPNSDRFSDTIIRLPFYYALKNSQIRYIANAIEKFFKK